MALGFAQAAGNGRKAPVLIWLVELGRVDACGRKARTKLHQLLLVTNGEVDVRGMCREIKSTSVLYSRVCGLDCLLREWDVAARNAVKVRMALHDSLTG